MITVYSASHSTGWCSITWLLYITSRYFICSSCLQLCCLLSCEGTQWLGDICMNNPMFVLAMYNLLHGCHHLYRVLIPLQTPLQLWLLTVIKRIIQVRQMSVQYQMLLLK
ncbi:hypothetical protein XELAEV_18047206mg [Xenopus laevis]|uniref:Uncharacterized protein n=1 Tax=Xenopus laevis TaxID=8355 RepID=A0A974BUF3_XENLA|nr:hypothetical protein XELAEV_18047206mg [Xenopus laevis]